jgi:hypothetical protein
LEESDPFSESHLISAIDKKWPLSRKGGNLRGSGIAGAEMNSWILWKEPMPPINDERAIMSEPRGSESSVNRESEVKTLAVSSVLVPSLCWARTENTANARTGDTIGEI